MDRIDHVRRMFAEINESRKTACKSLKCVCYQCRNNKCVKQWCLGRINVPDCQGHKECEDKVK